MRNRIFDWLPPPKGGDGAWLNMPKQAKGRKSEGGFASLDHQRFASRFAQELAKWLAAEPARTKRQFAEFCGTDDRLVQRWETEGVGKMEVLPGSTLAYASAFLGVEPNSWWNNAGVARVNAAKSPSPLDADIASALVTHARREAFVNPGFRRELQELLERHKSHS